jgi:hypothetical protein
MNFKWTVNKVTVAEDNLIVRVDFTVTATDGDNTASTVYARDLVRGVSFIPYSQLTEQQVLNWCFEPQILSWKGADNVDKSVVRLIKDEGEANVAGQIARQLEKKAAEPALPWA